MKTKGSGQALLWLSADLGDIRAIEPLTQVLKEDESIQVQRGASEALGKLNHTK